MFSFSLIEFVFHEKINRVAGMDFSWQLLVHTFFTLHLHNIIKTIVG